MKIHSAYARDKFFESLDPKALVKIIIDRFSKFQQLHDASYVDTKGKIDEILSSLISTHSGTELKRDYFICAASGYGKTSFMTTLASKINAVYQSQKWWVGSNNFAQESEQFLSRISASKDYWMELTLDEFNKDLISGLKSTTKDVNNWIILIDGLNKDNIDDFENYFGSFVDNASNRFIISSDDCSIYGKLSNKFPKRKHFPGSGIVSRELIKTELDAYGSDEAQIIIKSMSDWSRSYNTHEIQQLVKISQGIPAKLVKLLRYFNDNPEISCDQIASQYDTLVNMHQHPSPEVWLLLMDTANDRDMNSLLNFLKQVLVLYQPAITDTVTEVTIDLEAICLLELVARNEAVAHLDYLVQKSLAVRIEHSSMYALHQSIISEISYLLDIDGTIVRSDLTGKVVRALNLHFPQGEDISSYDGKGTNLKHYLDSFASFISSIKDLKAVITEDRKEIAELCFKVSNALRDVAHHSSAKYLSIAQQYLDDQPSDLSIKISTLAAKSFANEMDYTKALTYSEISLAHMETLGRTDYSPDYLIAKARHLDYMFLANSHNNTEILNSILIKLIEFHLTSIQALQRIFKEEDSNLSNYSEQFLDINLAMADVYTEVFFNLQLLQSFSVHINAQNSQFFGEKQLINLEEILCFIGSNLLNIYHRHVEQKLQVDGNLIIALTKINSAIIQFGGAQEQTCDKFAPVSDTSEDLDYLANLTRTLGTKKLAEELSDLLVSRDMIKELLVPKLLELMNKSIITVEDINLWHLNNNFLKQIEEWLDRIQHIDKSNLSPQYYASIAPLIEGAAYWLSNKLEFDLFHCDQNGKNHESKHMDFALISNIAYKMLDYSRALYSENNLPYNERLSYATSIKLWPLFNSLDTDTIVFNSIKEINSGLLPLAEYYFGKMTASIVTTALETNSMLRKFAKQNENSLEEYAKGVLAVYYNSTLVVNNNNSSSVEVTTFNGPIYDINSLSFDQNFAGKLLSIANHSLSKIEIFGGNPRPDGHLLYLANYLLDRDCNLNFKIALHMAFLKVNEILAKESVGADIDYLYAHGNILEAIRISERYGIEFNFDKLLLKNSVLMCANQSNLLFKHLCSAVVIKKYQDNPNQLIETATDLGVDLKLFDLDTVEEKLYDFANHVPSTLSSQIRYDNMANSSDSNDNSIFEKAFYKHALQTSILPIIEIDW